MSSWNWQQASAQLKLFRDRLAALRHHDARYSDDLIGLDIDAESLKLLQIDTSTSPYQIKHYVMAPLPIGAIAKSEIKDIATISTVLGEMITQPAIKTKNVAIAIPRSLAIIKTILISSQLTPEEIESRAWIEAGRHFPDLIGDIYLDFAITGTEIAGRRHDDPLQQELMLVACRKAQIQPYLTIIENAGLIPKIVDVNCYALERSLALLEESTKPYETIALLNLNSSLSSLVVLHKGKLIHAHDESFDGQHLMNQISDYLREKNTSESQTVDALNNDELYNAILRNNLISHLRHIVQFIYSSHPDLNIQQIILAGDCASIPTSASFTEREIGTRSIIANPFSNMICDQGVNQFELHANAPGLMLCTGLALSHLNTGEEQL